MSENGEVDKISELPDDVLVAIISLLTWREALATSILSTRWRRLYTYITRLTHSTQHHSKQLKDKYVRRLQKKEFPKYIEEIHDFLASSKSCRFLKEFKVHIPCLKGAKFKFWLSLVLEREVESIDIRMIYHTGAMAGYYNFPIKTLIKRKDGGLGSFPGLKSLRKLSLDSLHVDDQDVELFVSNCTVLEHLSIVGSDRLKNVSLVGHSKLKHLDISYSRNVVSIEVRDMTNLVSLTCYKLYPRHSAPFYSLSLKNVPKLVDFNSSDQCHLLRRIFPMISSYILDQLLHISVHSKDFYYDWTTRFIPVFTNLKHLKLQMKWKDVSRNTLPYFPLFWDCPSLQKLEIKLLWWYFKAVDHRDFVLMFEGHGSRFSAAPQPKNYHLKLKEVTISGYRGSLEELNLAWLIIRKAVALEKLIVELCHKTPEIRQRAAALAPEHLRLITPASVNLTII